MSAAFEADFGAEFFDAGAVSSVVDASGTEFLANYTDEFYASIGIDPATLSTFADAPISDLADINEWAQIGSVAGDADWYDAFKGEDLKTPSLVGVEQDPFEFERLRIENELVLNPGPTEVDIIRSLPFGDAVKAIGNQIVTDFKIFGQDAAAAIQKISNFSPIINAVSSAFGIQSPVGQIIQPIAQAAGIASTVSGVAGLAANPTSTSIFTDPVVRAALFTAVSVAVPGAGRAISTGVAAYNLAQAVGALLPPVTEPGAVSTGTGVVGLTTDTVTPRSINTGTDFRELTLEETIQLERNISPLYRSTITETGSLYVPVEADTGATFRELDAVETAILERNIDPIYRSVTTLPIDPAKRETYTQALQTVESTTAALREFDAYKSQTTTEILNTSDNIYNISTRLEDPTLSVEERALLDQELAGEYDKLAVAQSALSQTNNAITLVSDARNQATEIIVSTNATRVTVPAAVGGPVTDQYSVVKSPNGTYSIFDRTTSTTVQSGLSEQAAILQIGNLAITTAGITEKTATPVAIDGGDLGEIVITASRIVDTPAGITTAETNQARQQQTVRELRNNAAQSGDWRVRLRLAPNSNYLYNAPSPGILSALKATDGVIFPYTPSIETAYKANYDPYELTHSNYRGYFYKGSYVDAVNVRGTFTAQDSKEADYLLAVIHFFRSCTKMFYGANDQQRGAPPPLVYLNGYGDYQFSEHPCVVNQFNYTLPPDVDYIRAQSALTNNTNLLNNRLRNPIANNPLAYSVNRLLNSNLVQGALDFRPTLVGTGNLGISSPTYVPTKMEISITLLPIQSRSQISNNFSVKEFANGNLLKGGYW